MTFIVVCILYNISDEYCGIVNMVVIRVIGTQQIIVIDMILNFLGIIVVDKNSVTQCW